MNDPPTHRLTSVDLLRGVVMVLMALDHVRDFVAPSSVAPELMESPGLPLFLTRWVTHFCAPVFVFLAGTAAYLYGARRSRAELSRFLWTRGLWLIALEFTVVWTAWTFIPPFTRFVFLQVIFVIGAAMVLLAGLIRLPRVLVVAISLAAVLGHNLLDGLPLELGMSPGTGNTVPLASAEGLWAIVHVPFQMLAGPGQYWLPIYALLPWVFVLALGWAFGPVMARSPAERTRTCLQLGAALVALFVVLRVTGVYGDRVEFEAGGGATAVIISFLNTTKYPPSLQFLLMTLGPALIFLGLAERWTGPVARALSVFGRVPLFYYVLHIVLANLVGAAWLAWRFDADRWIGAVFKPPPEGAVQLVPLYVAWAAIVLFLYPLCRWYAGVKRRSRGWWWSYL